MMLKSVSLIMFSQCVLFVVFFVGLTYAAPVENGEVPLARQARSANIIKPNRIEVFEIDNESGAKTKILPIELGFGVDIKGDKDISIANGVLEEGVFPNGIFGHVDPKVGVIGTLGQHLIGKDPLNLGTGINFDLASPDLSLGLGLGKSKPSGNLFGPLLGDDAFGSLISSLINANRRR